MILYGHILGGPYLAAQSKDLSNSRIDTCALLIRSSLTICSYNVRWNLVAKFRIILTQFFSWIHVDRHLMISFEIST